MGKNRAVLFLSIVLVLVVVLVIDLCPWGGVSIAVADQT